MRKILPALTAICLSLGCETPDSDAQSNPEARAREEITEGIGAPPPRSSPSPQETTDPITPSQIEAHGGGPVDNSDLRINDAGLEIIKASEGLRLEAYSFGGRSYIGYGHQQRPGEPRRITQEEADRLLREDVKIAEDGVRALLTRRANANQFSAMVSLAYNIGVGNFGRSRVWRRFNEGDIQGAADAFLTHNRAGGVVLDHLTERRRQERAMFLTPVA